MATGETEEGRNRENITLRLSEDFLADLDERWQEEGYASRSEYIRESLRGSVYDIRLSKQALADLVTSERQIAAGETIDADAIREEVGADGDD